MNRRRRDKKILAIDIRPRSFGYVLFEGPNRLIDWGVRSFRNGVNAAKIPPQKKLNLLFGQFTPALLLLNAQTVISPKRRARLLAVAQYQAKAHGLPITVVTRKKIECAFAGTHHNKDAIARALAARFPELGPRLPPRRKCWQPEDYRMSIFDAAALGVAYYYRKHPPPPSNPA